MCFSLHSYIFFLYTAICFFFTQLYLFSLHSYVFFLYTDISFFFTQLYLFSLHSYMFFLKIWILKIYSYIQLHMKIYFFFFFPLLDPPFFFLALSILRTLNDLQNAWTVVAALTMRIIFLSDSSRNRRANSRSSMIMRYSFCRVANFSSSSPSCFFSSL